MGLTNRKKLANSVRNDLWEFADQYAKNIGANKSNVYDLIFETFEILSDDLDLLSVILKKDKLDLVKEARDLLREKYKDQLPPSAVKKTT